MSEADNRKKRSDVARLIGGDSAAVAATNLRLRAYEASGFVTPEIRPERVSQGTPFLGKFSGSNLLGSAPSDRRREHAAWMEHMRCGGLPPVPEPVQPSTLVDVAHYSPVDCQVIADRERKLAPLTPDFCRFAWGTDVDPEAMPVTAPTPTATVGRSGSDSKPVPVPVPTRVLTLRLEKRGILFDRRNKPVKVRDLLQVPGLIAAARTNTPRRGASGMWDEPAVLAWLESECYAWSSMHADVAETTSRTAAVTLGNCWRVSPRS